MISNKPIFLCTTDFDELSTLIDADHDVELYLVYENVAPVNDIEPPPGHKRLYEFLSDKRRPFVSSYDILAAHPVMQATLTSKLHIRVHAGLLRPAILPFIKAILARSIPIN